MDTGAVFRRKNSFFALVASPSCCTQQDKINPLCKENQAQEMIQSEALVKIPCK